MKRFVRVMDGLRSNAGGFEYKLDEVNESNVDTIITEFGDYSCNKDFSYDKLGEKSKEVYDLLKSKQSLPCFFISFFL